MKLFFPIATAAMLIHEASAFCNWGPDGTAATSTCQGGAQGGSWCNANEGQCEAGCGGRWCTSTGPSNDGFCNWGPDGSGSSSTCQGGAQGGEWCNASESNCEAGCGGRWCTVDGGGGSGSNGECPAGWKPASFTTYTSYAPCCRDSPNFDPTADTTECELYSACKYTGQFAYVGYRSFDWVKNNNIIAFFSSMGDNGWYGNKRMRVSTGDKTVEVLVADTCGDHDCNGCCSANAKPSGYLVDMEYWTVINNFGSISAAQGQVCWQIV